MVENASRHPSLVQRSVSIDSGGCDDDELVIPASVVPLKLPRVVRFRFEGTEMAKTPQKLKYFHWEGTVSEHQTDDTPKGINNRMRCGTTL